MVKLMISGDFSPRLRVAQLLDKGDYTSVFTEIQKLNSRADYSIVNFETTVADETDNPIIKQGPSLRCSPSALKALKWAGFDMVTLANNHFYDYGHAGLIKSFETIVNNHLDYVGAGLNLSEATKTFYKDIKQHTFAFINCCEHEFSIATDEHGGCNPLNPIQQYYAITEAKKNADYVIVIVHGGHEFFQLPNLAMKESYRFFVDAGADAVINHHQHCYSGYEFYKGKPIVYGLGNLCFDNGNTIKTMWHEGYVLQLDFYNDEIQLTPNPYIQCADTPDIRFIKDTRLFYSQLESLNNIIADDARLKAKINAYYSKSCKHYLSLFEPYSGRLLSAAWWHNLLPSTFHKQRIRQAQNWLNCESHLQRIKFAINKKFDQLKN